MSFSKRVVALTIIKMLITPFERTEAFRLGIIDGFGRRIRSPITSEEYSSYGPLQRLIFALKIILDKSGFGGKLTALSTAWHVVRESVEKESYDNQVLIEKRLQKYLAEGYSFIEDELEVESLLEEIAANNTSGVEVKNPGAIPKKKLKTVKDLVVRRTTGVDMSVQLDK